MLQMIRRSAARTGGILATCTLLWLSGWSASAQSTHTDAPADVGEGLYLSVTLDQDGKLTEALPLYRAQAEKTLTKADRLRYGAALLRAGRTAEATAVYDQVAHDAASAEHGGDGNARGPAVCASSLLASGFPVQALPYAWQAHRLRPSDPTLGLLLVRALAASGDSATARATLAEVAHDPQNWGIGQRMEVARWRLLTGDTASARLLLDGEGQEIVGQMFRDSILANVALREGQWETAAATLAESERKVPQGLGDKRVDRSWRNAQRELWSVQLRRSISLWKAGKTDLAVAEATKAARSDEEYVRSGAILLLAAADVARSQRAAAGTRLQALAGHDPRFQAAVAELEKAQVTGGRGAAQQQLQSSLGTLDRSVDFVTQPLCEIVVDATAGRAAAAAQAPPQAVPPLTMSSGR